MPGDSLFHITFGSETVHAELAALDEHAEGLIARMNTLIAQGAHAAIGPDQYDADYADLERKYQKADAKCIKTAEAIKDRETRRRQAHQVRDYLQTQPPLAYTPGAWNTLVAEAEVTANQTIAIRFKDGFVR